MATEWQRIQEEHYQSKGSKLSGKRWTIALIQKLWDVAWDQWEHRNDAVHRGQDAERLSQATNEKIRQEWQLGKDSVDQVTRPLFNRTLNDLLQSDIQVRQAWLDSIQLGQKAKQDEEEREDRELRRMRDLMQRYFSVA